MRARAAVAVAAILAVAGACGGSGKADFGLDEVVEALTGTGASVELAGQGAGFPFSVPQQRVTADGYDLSVYEYPDVAAQEAEAATILMDGWSVNHTPVEWIGSPHYWIQGRVIVLYLGDDEAAVALVTGALGAELDLVGLASACAGDDEPSRIEGTLWAVGGRDPGLDGPTAGTVRVYAATNGGEGSPPGLHAGPLIAESAVGSAGEFAIRLSPGSYVLAAEMRGGHACEVQVVQVRDGRCAQVVITCFVR